MTKQKTLWERFWTWITQPIRLPWIPEDIYQKEREEWKERHELIERPKITINMTKNIFGMKLKNKKTGEVFDINCDDFEIIKKNDE